MDAFYFQLKTIFDADESVSKKFKEKTNFEIYYEYFAKISAEFYLTPLCPFSFSLAKGWNLI